MAGRIHLVTNRPGYSTRRIGPYPFAMAATEGIWFLYHPSSVRELLASLPSLAAELRPEVEGQESEWFERVRKSERQIYRVLGNTHYPNLMQLLEAIDECLQHGYSQPRVLRTRARRSFAPDLAEIRVAEHFVIGGSEIAGFDDTKEGESVPDLLASREGFRVAVEVYCPLLFETLKKFHDDLVSGIKNVDLPYDFTFNLQFEQLERFDDRHRLLYLREGPLDEALGRDGLGPRIVDEFLTEVSDALDNPKRSLRIQRDESDLNLRIALTLDGIEQTPDRLPARFGVNGGPSTSPPNPEWVFGRVAKNAEAKAAEGQALTVDADAAVLVVDLTESDIPSELRSPHYRDKLFRPILEARADEALHGHTAIVFTESAGWHNPFIPWFLNSADIVTSELADMLDPRGVFARPSGT
jgi:hypothetical protein